MYLDPLGDEGLLPRADDCLFRLQVDSGTAQYLRWQYDSWSQRQASGFSAAAHSTIADNKLVDTYEFAIPLSDLNRPRMDAPLGLAVQTTYEVRPAVRLVEPAPAGAARGYWTVGWGGGPFSGHAFAGLSLRVGSQACGIVEYDGEEINLGYVTRTGAGKYNLLVGIHDLAGAEESRFVVGLSQQSEF